MDYRIIPTFLAWLAAAGLAAAEPPAAGQQAVLLDNGHVLYGEVFDEGDRLLVKLGPGSQVRLAKGQVAALGRTLRELFAIQRRRLRPDDIDRQVQLARWCSRQGLMDEAAEVLIGLTAIEAGHPKVAALEQQMRQSLENRPSPAAERIVPLAPAGQAPPTSEAESVSAETLAQFTQQIQPLLMNHCGASGCHGAAGKSDFQLLAPLRGGRWTRPMTQRNLQAAIRHVDRANTLESPLLLAATRPHGGLQTPVLTGPNHERGLQLLRAWLEAAGGDRGSATAAESGAPPSAETGLEQAPPLGETPEIEPQFPAVSPSENSAPQPRDPFDPDIFNRRYFPERFEEEKAER